MMFLKFSFCYDTHSYLIYVDVAYKRVLCVSDTRVPRKVDRVVVASGLT